ncbi:ABC transporter ATP-binding protein [Candidatus Saccharibacteria bacterium]|nr:ABC transporter ATP-binding protein [Candidatus Saccharibacteria bacterium]MBR3332062.1 ABC transporter ATP-binding protein [Candidatus Saccharibacteria bacterium]
MLKLFRYLKPYFWLCLVLLVATGAQVYTTLQLPSLMAHIINDGIVPGNTEYIWQTGGLMILLAIVSAGCSFLANYLAAKIGANFVRDIRADIFKKIMSLNTSDLEMYSTASLINRTTNDTNQVQQTIVMMLSLMLHAPLFCIISLVMAIQTAPDMSWIIALGIVLILCSTILIMSLVIPKFKIFQKLLDKITLITRENLTGLKVIRAFDNEDLEKRKFSKTNNELTKLLIFIDKILELQNPLINVIFNGLTLLCTYVGITLLTKDFAYLGNMSAFAQYVTFVMISFLMLSILFVMLPRANVSAERINEILKTSPKVHWKDKTIGIPEKVPSVEFKNVDFYYTNAEEKVLDNISFLAKAGETTAFIGSTGSGKSTLINLVPRFYEATSGEILVNGVNVDNYEKDDLMKRIGLVPQHGILFSGTVKSNIKFGAQNATDEQVVAAAKVAQADNFINKLPKKYDAHIAQGGTNVSGGQKQRLSIARAICKNPDIFIFDDSFSALDMKTDANLREALKPIVNDAVVLIVAQRVSTIKNADQIVVLDDGKIVGKGKHLELLKKCGIYKDIVKSQLSDKEFAREMKEAEHA